MPARTRDRWDAVVGLLGGHITAAASASMYAPQVRAGKLRILALMSYDRSPEFPEAVRLKDLGHSLVAEGFVGIGGPKGLPPAIVKKLEDAFAEAVKDTAYQELLKKLALQKQFMRSHEFASFLPETYRQQAELIKKSGVVK
jgi:tripartite-type tricarboxylate transporter receptor subunit TctC